MSQFSYYLISNKCNSFVWLQHTDKWIDDCDYIGLSILFVVRDALLQIKTHRHPTLRCYHFLGCGFSFRLLNNNEWLLAHYQSKIWTCLCKSAHCFLVVISCGIWMCFTELLSWFLCCFFRLWLFECSRIYRKSRSKKRQSSRKADKTKNGISSVHLLWFRLSWCLKNFKKISKDAEQR